MWLANHVRASQYFLQIVNCSNEKCCAAPRSSLQTILQHRFFPAPLAVVNTSEINVSDTMNPNGKFLSLFQRLSMKVPYAGLHDGKDSPYDQFCPTVRTVVDKRTCNLCNLYFPSQIMLAAHKKALHSHIIISDIPKVRPIRVAARRQRELMVIIASGEMEDVEWLDHSQVDTTGVDMPPVSSLSSLPVITDFLDGGSWEEE